MSELTTIIPSYNASELMQTYLPGVVQNLSGLGNIVVIDDASKDDSLQVLENQFPTVSVIARLKNGGFSASVNDGIRAASGDFIVLLNNDVEVSSNFLDSILPLFADDKVFAVSPRILLPKHDNVDEGAKIGFWHHGMLYTDQRSGCSQVLPILYTTGCAAIYRRSMLEALGGFDEAYSPFYWEDVDLGYRAWKRGWKSLYQPESAVHHMHSASISKIKSGYTNRIKARNSLLFIWRNIDDAQLLSKHRRWLPLVMARRAMSGDKAFLAGWQNAFALRHQAVDARRRDAAHRQISDREIFALVGMPVQV